MSRLTWNQNVLIALTYRKYSYTVYNPASIFTIAEQLITNSEDGSLLSIMRTNITLTKNDFKLIIDTKFYGKHFNKTC